MTLREMLFERTVNEKDRLGCLMAMVDDSVCDKLMEFNQKIISDDQLYHEFNEEGEDEYGREKECHVTILYGFLKDLNELDVRKLLSGTEEFTVQVTSLDIFDSNPNFDVVKFNVESPVLTRLNTMAKIYPNKNDYPEYHPHLTLAYVKKGTFPHKKEIKMEIPINHVIYSPISGDKSSFPLNEGNIESDVDARISKLEQEWERIDSTGVGKSRQKEIERELIQLRYNKQMDEPIPQKSVQEPTGSTEPLPVDPEKAKQLFARLKNAV